MKTRAVAATLTLAVLLSGCAAVPPGAYYPLPSDPATARVAHVLHRAAVAAGDDPARYGFAFVKTPMAAAFSDEDAIFYFTEGLATLPQLIVEAVVAHEVAHEVLGHIGTRRALALSITAGFSLLGIVAPGVSLLDFLANPIAVRAFSRRQELEADQKAVEILRAMGHAAPRQALALALRALSAASPRPKEDPGGLLASHPGLDDRLAALEPLEAPLPLASRPGAGPAK